MLVLTVSACTYKAEEDGYPKDIKVSNSEGEPKDSLTFYLPASICRDDHKIISEIDTLNLLWYSSSLYCTKEPILYNYYLGHDIYRFLWLRSFHRPIVLTLHKDGNNVWLDMKELDRQPRFLDEHIVTIKNIRFLPPLDEKTGEIDSTIKLDPPEIITDSIIKADRQAKITLTLRKQLSLKEWAEFESILDSFSYWTTKPSWDSRGMDGSEWLIEGHSNNKYWFVHRWSPSDSLKVAGMYLISKSGIKENIY